MLTANNSLIISILAKTELILADEEYRDLLSEAELQLLSELVDAAGGSIEKLFLVMRDDNGNVTTPVYNNSLYISTLASPLLLADTTISLSENIEDLVGTGPGTLWIGGERITYLSASGSQVTGLGRGTRNTNRTLIHPISSSVYSETVIINLITKVPFLIGESITDTGL